MTKPEEGEKTASTTDQLTKVTYGSGSIAYTVKDYGFGFILIFYGAVLGVPPALTSLAIFIALMVDAVSDPIIGYWSDSLRSRWGRRHPFMYASALPVSIGVFLLFNPPADLRGADLFPYLLFLAILIRVSITLYEIPSLSLVAELTDDYDQRTSFVSYRVLFGAVGAFAVSIFTLTQLLVATDDEPNGYFNLEGYSQYGALAAIVIFAAIMVSALGTHKHIPKLRQPPANRSFDFKRALSELLESFSNPSFIAIFLASLMFGMASGIASNLNHHINNFFWQLSPRQVGAISVAAFFSAGIAFKFAPYVTEKIGKKRGAIIIGTIAFFASPLAIALSLIGWFPATGTDALFYTLVVFVLVDFSLIFTAQILMTSMIADIVEDSETKTGRRSEGLFFAAQTFAKKSVSGLGALSAGLMLSAVSFPAGRRPESVDPEIIRNLATLYVPCMLTVYALGILLLSFYKIDREKHEANLQRLSASPDITPVPAFDAKTTAAAPALKPVGAATADQTHTSLLESSHNPAVDSATSAQESQIQNDQGSSESEQNVAAPSVQQERPAKGTDYL